MLASAIGLMFVLQETLEITGLQLTASTFKNHKILYNLFKRVFAQSLVHCKVGDILGSDGFFQALNEI